MTRFPTAVAVTVLGLVLSNGCAKDKPVDQVSSAPSSSAPAPRPEPRAEVSVGDTVVVESGDATFVSGRVVKVADGVTYEQGSRKATAQSPKDRVYPVTSDQASKVSVNDFAVCRTAPTTWTGCLVKQQRQAVLEVEDALGKVYELPTADVLALREEARERIGRKHKEMADHRDFFAAVSRAKQPARPEGWEARPGDEIVARHDDGSWRGGRIRRLTPTKVHVSWDDKSPLSERDPAEVAPKPKKPQEVLPGQMVLARPRKGTVWDFFRVESVDGKGVVIVDRDGGSRKARKSDVIPFGG
jgi:hypothetical protein